ncbi:MAG: ComF family protein [Bacteroidota bacterium]
MATLQTPKTLQTLQLLTRPIYQFIFPPVCFSCGNSLADTERKVCSICWSSIRQVFEADEVYCDTFEKLNEGGDVSALISKYYFDKDGPLQSLVHDLKYEGMTSLGVILGEHVGELLRRQVDPATIAGLIPVPLHKTKLRERGYNQSEYICKGISNVTGIPVFPKLLRRTRYTESQTQLDISERKENVSEAFALRSTSKVPIAKQKFIIVDDVITTGATIKSCAQVLLAKGAESVVACSVALAP